MKTKSFALAVIVTASCWDLLMQVAHGLENSALRGLEGLEEQEAQEKGTLKESSPEKEIIAALEKHGANKKTLNDDKSPQGRAVQFLVKDEWAEKKKIKFKERVYYERWAMVVMAYSITIDKDGTGTFKKWLGDEGICNWWGVSCNGKGLVVKIEIMDTWVGGYIPNEVKVFQQMTHLNLRENNHRGKLPDGLCELAKLEYFDTYRSKLEAPIPTCLVKLKKLKHLNLGRTQHLLKKIPDFIGQLKNLEFLGLVGMQMEGPLEPELFKLTKLQVLDLGWNHVNGEILPDLAKLKKLRFLNLHNNDFSKEIPPDLGKLKKLECMQLGDNRLKGEMPAEICALRKKKLKQLTVNEDRVECKCCTNSGCTRLTTLPP